MGQRLECHIWIYLGDGFRLPAAKVNSSVWMGLAHRQMILLIWRIHRDGTKRKRIRSDHSALVLKSFFFFFRGGNCGSRSIKNLPKIAFHQCPACPRSSGRKYPTVYCGRPPPFQLVPLPWEKPWEKESSWRSPGGFFAWALLTKLQSWHT